MNNLTIIMGRVYQDLLKSNQNRYEVNQMQNNKVKKALINIRKEHTQGLNLRVGATKWNQEVGVKLANFQKAKVVNKAKVKVLGQVAAGLKAEVAGAKIVREVELIRIANL